MDYAILCKKSYENNIEGFKSVFDEKTDTQCFVESGGSVVTIVFRGTNSLRDWKYDLQILRKCTGYLNNTFVHTGFLKQYESVRERLHQYMNPDVKHVICVGSSLGGALSTICALDMKLTFPFLEKVSCITCGSPRVGGTRFAKLFNEKVDNSYRYVAYKDPVTFSPLPLRFRHVKGGKKVRADSLEMSEPDVYCFCGCRISDHSCDTYIECLKGVTLNL
tara:strand:- start:153 stop:812 length:660 start_codon:yes stop_codon:yes gene_type:complete